VGLLQVGLFDDPDLEVERDEEQHEPGERDDVGHHEREPEAGERHRSEDRGADQCERAGGDQVGALGLVQSDAPVGAHRHLGEEGGEHSGDGEHGAGGLHGGGGDCVERAEAE
jgi:hypothetical protein